MSRPRSLPHHPRPETAAPLVFRSPSPPHHPRPETAAPKTRPITHTQRPAPDSHPISPARKQPPHSCLDPIPIPAPSSPPGNRRPARVYITSPSPPHHPDPESAAPHPRPIIHARKDPPQIPASSAPPGNSRPAANPRSPRRIIPLPHQPPTPIRFRPTPPRHHPHVLRIHVNASPSAFTTLPVGPSLSAVPGPLSPLIPHPFPFGYLRRIPFRFYRQKKPSSKYSTPVRGLRVGHQHVSYIDLAVLTATNGIFRKEPCAFERFFNIGNGRNQVTLLENQELYKEVARLHQMGWFLVAFHKRAQEKHKSIALADIQKIQVTRARVGNRVSAKLPRSSYISPPSASFVMENPVRGKFLGN
ncbi:hypothetical protein B0H14DRAFT_2653799 [Mycena olivaceomarginata]|nr:hypothetical protein B0H14DRAFT_2653799 [Mycena olivaceomarginata]